MKVRFESEALREFIEAGKYYNTQLPGLGDCFLDEVETGIAMVCQDPFVWRILEGDIRRYLVKRFPYGIYYSVENV